MEYSTIKKIGGFIKVEHKKHGFKGEIDLYEKVPKVYWRNDAITPFSLRVDFSAILRITEATTIQLNKLRPFQGKMVEEYENTCKNGHDFESIYIDTFQMEMNDSAFMKCRDCRLKKSLPQYLIVNNSRLLKNKKTRDSLIKEWCEKYNIALRG